MTTRNCCAHAVWLWQRRKPAIWLELHSWLQQNKSRGNRDTILPMFKFVGWFGYQTPPLSSCALKRSGRLGTRLVQSYVCPTSCHSWYHRVDLFDSADVINIRPHKLFIVDTFSIFHAGERSLYSSLRTMLDMLVRLKVTHACCTVLIHRQVFYLLVCR